VSRVEDAFHSKLAREIMERIRVEVKNLELMGRITEKVLENFIGDLGIEIAKN